MSKSLAKTCANILMNEFRGMCNAYDTTPWQSGISATELGTLACFAHNGYRREALCLLKRRMNKLHGEV